MELIAIGNAGTMESNDIMITVEPADNGGIQVELTSNVYQQFGKQIMTGWRRSSAVLRCIDCLRRSRTY